MNGGVLQQSRPFWSTTLLLLAVKHAESFTLTPQSARFPQRRSPVRTAVDPNEGFGSETASSSSYEVHEVSTTSASSSSPAITPPLLENTDSLLDLGSDFFMASMDESLVSKDILQSIATTATTEFLENDVIVSPISVGTAGVEVTITTTPASPDVSSSSAAAAAFESSSPSDFGLDDASSTISSSGSSTSTDIPMDDTETISAILAASSEAVEMAEASGVLEVFEPAPTNATMETATVDSSSIFVGISETDVEEYSKPSTTPPLPEILPVSQVLGETATSPPSTTTTVPTKTDSPATTTVKAPTVGQILKFAIPAIGVWLCGPLLSLIDTASVGLLAGTTHQAALNPAVAVTDYAALLIAFLYTATTNLMAAARESESVATDSTDVVEGPGSTKSTLVGAMQLSGYVGAALGTVLFVGGPQLLGAILGGRNTVSPAVFDAALKYVRIRAIGMPAAAIIGSAQAACLGLQDIQSPLYVLVAAAVVNLLGDVLFVGTGHPWLGGAAGAAWATVLSQWAAVGLFSHWMTRRPSAVGKVSSTPAPKPKKSVVNVSKAILELTGSHRQAGAQRRKQFRDTLRSWRRPNKRNESIATANDVTSASSSDGTFSVRGFLKGQFALRDLLRLPNRSIVKEFMPYVLPVTSTQVGRVSGYVAMSHVVSSSMGTISMAAQQVVLSLFYCLTPIADSLSLTAQSFVPSVSEKKVSPERATALGTMGRNFGKAGMIFGAAMAGAVLSIPFVSSFFTADPAVVALVNTVAPYLIGIFSVHGLVCAMEGLLLGQKDLGFLGRMYSSYFFVVPYFMLRVKRAALTGTRAIGLTSVWQVFLGYQMFRCAGWLARVAVLQRETAREAREVSSLA